MSTHALFSASGSKKWTTCAASILLEKPYPNTTSRYAEEGSKAHAVCEAVLRSEPYPDGYTDEMVEHAVKYKTYIQDIRYQYDDAECYIEERFDYSEVIGVPDSFGTCDFALVSDSDLHIVDFKYGAGEPVYPEQNSQLMLYALGVYERFKFTRDIKVVMLHIYQPRTIKGINSWVCSIDELLSFGEKTRIAAQKAYKIYETGEYTEQDAVPTYDGCRWCKHKHECAALQAMALDDVGKVPTPDRLGLLFDKIDMVKLWADSIVEAVTNAVKSGQTVVGADGPYKLVAGRRGHRKWIDESQVESIMKSMRLKADEMYNKTLISPTTAEKLLKDKPQSWVKLSPLYTQSESSPVVAKATDKRPAIEVEPDFGPVEDS